LDESGANCALTRIEFTKTSIRARRIRLDRGIRTIVDLAILPSNVNPLSQRDLYVCDYLSHRIWMLSDVASIQHPTYHPLAAWQVIGCRDRGSLDGEASKCSFNQPRRLTPDSFGQLYIADEMNRRIRIYNTRTGHVSTYIRDGDTQLSVQEPNHLCFVQHSNVLLYTSTSNHLWVVRPQLYHLDVAAAIYCALPTRPMTRTILLLIAAYTLENYDLTFDQFYNKQSEDNKAALCIEACTIRRFHAQRAARNERKERTSFAACALQDAAQSRLHQELPAEFFEKTVPYDYRGHPTHGY